MEIRQHGQMRRNGLTAFAVIGFLFAILGMACNSYRLTNQKSDLRAFKEIAAEIDFPNVEVKTNYNWSDISPPNTLLNQQDFVFRDITLSEAFRIALDNSDVIRRLGGHIIRQPRNVASSYDTEIQKANPLHGPAAALSDFDTQFSTGVGITQDEIPFNNSLLGGGSNLLNLHASRHTTAVSKTFLTGTQLFLGTVLDYGRNNSPFNLFPGAFTTELVAGVRHPLLQGSGIEFNRIGGPNAAVGNYRGILVAQIQTKSTATDFELSLREFLREVEQVYWELFFAYRQYQARVSFRNAAWELLKIAEQRVRLGIEEPLIEAHVRKQFFFAKAQAENALNGTPFVTSSTTPRAVATGVLKLERRLRWLLGLPPQAGELLHPSEPPCQIRVFFDWPDSLASALSQRAELDLQKTNVRLRELELLAARNFLKVRLDIVAGYRRRGFGENLIARDSSHFNGAFNSLFSDSLDSWEVGAELTRPLGNRIGKTAVRHAELMLARERAIRRNQTLRVAHELSDAMAELVRAHAVIQTNLQRINAVRDVEQLEQRLVDAGEKITRDLLEAQQQLAEADVDYHRSLVDYNLAISGVHRARGTLLQFYEVEIANTSADY